MIFFFSKEQENSIDLDKENSAPRSEAIGADGTTSTPVEKKKQKQSKEQHICCNMCDAIFKRNKSLIEHQVKFHAVKRKYLEAASKRKASLEFAEDDAGRFVTAQTKRKRPIKLCNTSKSSLYE